MKPLLPIPEPTRAEFRPTEKDRAEAKQFAAEALASPAVKGEPRKLRAKYRHLCKMAERKMDSRYSGVYGEFIRTYLARAQALRELIEQPNA